MTAPEPSPPSAVRARLPTRSAAGALASPRVIIAAVVVAVVIAAILVLPRFFEAARVLSQGSTPPGLVHREGLIVQASDCFRPAAYDGQSAMQVSIDDAKGIEIVTIPCLDDRRALASPPAHRLGVDVDSRAAQVGRVQQVTLDGRTLLSADAIAERRHQEVTTPALVTVVASLAGLAIACALIGWLLLRLRRGALQ